MMQLSREFAALGLLDAALFGSACGAWAFLWCRVLTAPGMAGNFVPALYWRLVGPYKNWKEWLSKPLFDCPVCNAFWIAFGFMVAPNAATVTIFEGFLIVVAALFVAFYLDRKYGE